MFIFGCLVCTTICSVLVPLGWLLYQWGVDEGRQEERKRQVIYAAGFNAGREAAKEEAALPLPENNNDSPG